MDWPFDLLDYRYSAAQEGVEIQTLTNCYPDRRPYQTDHRKSLVVGVKNRLSPQLANWPIPCSGTTVYAPRHRAEWLAKIPQPGVHRRGERLYQQLDLLQPVRHEARRNLL